MSSKIRSLARLLIVAALIAPIGAARALEYVCSMDGAVHRSSCCEDEVSQDDHCPRLEKPGCCSVRPGHEDPSARASKAAGADRPQLSSVILPVIEAVTPPIAIARAAEHRPRLAHGPPTFLLHCTILC